MHRKTNNVRPDLIATRSEVGEAVTVMSTPAREFDKPGLLTIDDEILVRLLDSMPIPLVLLGRDGTIQFMNKAMENLTEHSLCEVKGESFVSTFVLEREQTKEKEILDSLFRLQQPATHPCAIRTKGGYEAVKNWTSICFPDSLGRTCAVALMEHCDRWTPDPVDQLTKAQDFLQFVLGNLGAGIAVIDKSWRVDYVGGNLLARFPEAVGKFCYEAFGSAPSVCEHCPIRQILKSEEEVSQGKRENLLARAEAKSPQCRCMTGHDYSRLVAWPATDGQGRLVKNTILVIASSDERSLQEDLRTTRESLRTLLSHSPDGILMLDATTDEILGANGQACSMLRAQEDTLVGSKACNILAAECRTDFKNLVSRKLAKSGDYFQMNAVVEKTTGHRLPVELLAALIETNGTKRVQMTLRDVSKERRIQGQLRSQSSLLQNVNDAIVSVDANETVLFMNKKAENVYGLNAEDALCRSLHDVVKYEFLDPAQEQEFRNVISERGFWRGEQIHYHKDGHLINIDVSVSAVNDDEGTPTGYVMVMRDVTARKEAERKLKRRGDEMAALLEIGQAISAHLNLQDVLAVIHAQVARLMRARNFYVALADLARDEIHFPIYIDEMVCKNGSSRKSGKGYTEYVIQTGHPLLLGSQTEKQMQKDGYQGIGPQALSWLGVPLRLRQEVIGMMAVQSYARANLYGEDDVRILSAISDQAAIAIGNAKMFEQVRLSEEIYRNLVESMNEGYVVLQEERIAFVNSAFCELSSYGKEELLRRKFIEFLSQESHAIMDRVYKSKPMNSQEEMPSQLTLVSRDGNKLRLEFRFRSLTHKAGPVLVGICPRSRDDLPEAT